MRFNSTAPGFTRAIREVASPGPRKSTLGNLLEDLQRRPDIYLGRPSVTALRHFLDGYAFCQYQLNAQNPNDAAQWTDFQMWMTASLAMGRNEHWEQALLYCYGDEELAFEGFFALWTQFLGGQH